MPSPGAQTSWPSVKPSPNMEYCDTYMKRPSGMAAASTGAPWMVSPCPLMRNVSASISSGIVSTSSSVFASYTVIECLYIMFCAKT